MVWIKSAVYSTPKFIFSRTITNIHTSNEISEEICVMDRNQFNSKLLDFINFALLYVLPLLVMTVSVYDWKFNLCVMYVLRVLPSSSSGFECETYGMTECVTCHIQPIQWCGFIKPQNKTKKTLPQSIFTSNQLLWLKCIYWYSIGALNTDKTISALNYKRFACKIHPILVSTKRCG